jgi:hypothetical protein
LKDRNIARDSAPDKRVTPIFREKLKLRKRTVRTDDGITRDTTPREGDIPTIRDKLKLRNYVIDTKKAAHIKKVASEQREIFGKPLAREVKISDTTKRTPPRKVLVVTRRRGEIHERQRIVPRTEYAPGERFCGSVAHSGDLNGDA